MFQKGFVKVDQWIFLFLNCYMDLSKLFYAFLALCQKKPSWRFQILSKLLLWIKIVEWVKVLNAMGPLRLWQCFLVIWLPVELSELPMVQLKVVLNEFHSHVPWTDFILLGSNPDKIIGFFAYVFVCFPSDKKSRVSFQWFLNGFPTLSEIPLHWLLPWSSRWNSSHIWSMTEFFPLLTMKSIIRRLFAPFTVKSKF